MFVTTTKRMPGEVSSKLAAFSPGSPRSFRHRFFLSCLTICIFFPLGGHGSSFLFNQLRHYASSLDNSYGGSNCKTSAAPLSVFQVHQPAVSLPLDQFSGSCSTTQTLMEHSFAWSYGHPFVGVYYPPSCKFNHVTFNYSVVSAGRQFDRLGLMFFGDVEVFRTSTAEPTQNGIVWTYLKDMSHLLSLFQTPQKIIFDLGNLIDDTYTAPFNATLTATFSFVASESEHADSILPISSRQASANASSAFTLPSDSAINSIVFPRNARRAVVSLSACGQADEEFWFGNVYQSDQWAFPKISPMLGYSPFREVQLLIDGELAGVVWPFPIIFTGGVVPGLWRPIVGIDAFDLREQEIDISPWLPRLCDGDPKGHTFEIRVVGIEDDGRGKGSLSRMVGNNWPVTGKIFLWLDPPGSITRGALFYAETHQPSISLESVVGQNSSGENTTLQYQTSVQRYIMVNSVVFTATSYIHHKWIQALTYSSFVNFTNTGGVQVIDQLTKGVDKSSSGYQRVYRYPIWSNTSFNLDPSSGNFTIDAPIRRGLDLQVFGPAVFPSGLEPFQTSRGDRLLTGSKLSTTQNGSAHYLGVPSKHAAYGSGSTDQVFEFSGSGSPHDEDSSARVWEPLYSRTVKARNGAVVSDIEVILGDAKTDLQCLIADQPTSLDDDEVAFEDPARLLGRRFQLAH